MERCNNAINVIKPQEHIKDSSARVDNITHNPQCHSKSCFHFTEEGSGEESLGAWHRVQLQERENEEDSGRLDVPEPYNSVRRRDLELAWIATGPWLLLWMAGFRERWATWRYVGRKENTQTPARRFVLTILIDGAERDFQASAFSIV